MVVLHNCDRRRRCDGVNHPKSRPSVKIFVAVDIRPRHRLLGGCHQICGGWRLVGVPYHSDRFGMTAPGTHRVDLVHVDDKLLNSGTKIHHSMLQIGDGFVHLQLSSVELLLHHGHFSHSDLKVGNALVVLTDHGEDPIELLLCLHYRMESGLVVV